MARAAVKLVAERAAPVVDESAVAGPGDQARRVQGTEMLRHRARRHPEAAGQFDRGRRFLKERQEPDAGLAKQRDQGAREAGGGADQSVATPRQGYDSIGGSSALTGGAGWWAKTDGISSRPRPAEAACQWPIMPPMDKTPSCQRTLGCTSANN